MSNPFETFRTHRTYWMAGTILLAVLAFIVAPAIQSVMDLQKSNSGASNEVVVRWANGKITNGTLAYTRHQHSRAMQFLQALGREVIKDGGMPKVPGFVYDPTRKVIQSVGLQAIETDISMCRIILLVERGKQLGVNLDRKAVDDFFYRYCDRKINSKRFEEILRETVGRELSIQALYKQMELELTASIMEGLVLAGVNFEGNPLVTPGNLWQNYLRFNQAARVEAYPILTRDFVSQVKETPSEADIRALYETGASNFPSPNSPLPGFRRRYQADLEYVSGSFNKMVEEEVKKIPEDAIKAEYERMVALGGLKVPVTPEKPAEPTAARPDEGTPPSPSAGDKSTDTKPADAKPADASGDKPAEPKPAEPKPGEQKPAAETSSEEKPKADTPAEPKQSRVDRDSTIRLVAFQQDETPPPVQNPAPPTDTPKADAPKADGTATETASPTAQPAAAAVGTPSTPSSTPSDSSAVAPAAAQPTGVAGVAGGAAPLAKEPPPMRTQTLEEARESVARSLASRNMAQALEQKLSRIEKEMRAYSQALQLERINAEANRKNDKPAKPVDLKKLAESEGLTYGSTGLNDGFRLANTQIGRSRIENRELVNVVMNPNVGLFMPVQSMLFEMSGTQPEFLNFVSWKIKETAAYTPSLTDIRDEVVEVWKTQRARNLAREDAEKLVEKLKKAGDEPWKSVLDAQQQTLLLNPIPFTWMTATNDMSGGPQLTFVQGLDSVGQEFMQRVFATPVGQFTVAPNEALNTYYVVRVVELTPTVDQLRQNFDVSRGRARELAFGDRGQIFSDWYGQIEQQLGVQWVASPEQLMD